MIDHADRGAEGFFSVVGGKMSDFRLMAEATAAVVHRRIGRGEFRSVSAGRDLAGQPLGEWEGGAAPSARLKRILDRHPRVREAHALAHLAAAFVRHAALRRFRPVSTATLEDVLRHYQ
ncbi:MAG: hypothetical protein IPN65_00880 [Elusimicrobia bacterium]|nr:hypothetical protein [Elusimicrobiota bacterium]